MTKLTSTLLLLAALLALLGGGLFLYDKFAAEVQPQTIVETEQPGDVVPSETPEDPSAQPEDEPDLAPDFTVVDAEGNEVTLSEQRGKPVVLNFWASWCGPCKSEMPDFEAAFQAHGDEVVFMMINLTDGSRETVQTACDFIAQQGYTFPVYFDTTYSAAMTYPTSAIPVTFFLDAEGYLVAYGQGALSADTLQQGIDMILN